MTSNLKNKPAVFSEENISPWFDELISKVVGTLRTDEITLSTNTASDQKKELYKGLMHGDFSSMFQQNREGSTRFFITNLVLDFMAYLKESEKRPLKLALDFTDAKVLVWAEIQDNDELTEDELLIIEAKVNAKYSKHGFHVSSTIVESSDKIEVPSHYRPFSIKQLN